MVESIKITIRASGAHPDVLTVQDAMQQVLDIFHLLSGGMAAGVTWKLTKASTNSPFYLEGEAVSLATNVNAEAEARAQKAIFAEGLLSYQRGEVFEAWKDQQQAKIAESLFKRNLNGVGSTNIDLGDKEPIVITPQRAEMALATISRKTEHEKMYTFPAAQEYGSFEGVLKELSTHNNNPAVRVTDRKTGRDIWCHLTLELQARLNEKAAYEDFWKHQRVIVRGRIIRNNQGMITLAQSEDIERINPKEVSELDLYDPNFASGLPISEYLERFREGTLEKNN